MVILPGILSKSDFTFKEGSVKISGLVTGFACNSRKRSFELRSEKGRVRSRQQSHVQTLSFFVEHFLRKFRKHHIQLTFARGMVMLFLHLAHFSNFFFLGLIHRWQTQGSVSFKEKYSDLLFRFEVHFI